MNGARHQLVVDLAAMTEKRDELQVQHNKALARIERQDQQIEKQITALKIVREDLEEEQQGRRKDREEHAQ